MWGNSYFFGTTNSVIDIAGKITFLMLLVSAHAAIATSAAF